MDGLEYGTLLHRLRSGTLCHRLGTLNRLDAINRLKGVETRTLGGGTRINRQIPVDDVSSPSLLRQLNTTIGGQIGSVTRRFARLLRSSTPDHSHTTIRFSDHWGSRCYRCRCHGCCRCYRCISQVQATA